MTSIQLVLTDDQVDELYQTKMQNEGVDTVVLSLATGIGYTIGEESSGTIRIADSPATLYVATEFLAGTVGELTQALELVGHLAPMDRRTPRSHTSAGA